MAKQSQIARKLKQDKKVKFPTRRHNRCGRCGKSRCYIGKLGICRNCLKELASKGVLPGVTKSS
jgi:small subunit ribosomal protein S14